MRKCIELFENSTYCSDFLVMMVVMVLYPL